VLKILTPKWYTYRKRRGHRPNVLCLLTVWWCYLRT